MNHPPKIFVWITQHTQSESPKVGFAQKAMSKVANFFRKKTPSKVEITIHIKCIAHNSESCEYDTIYGNEAIDSLAGLEAAIVDIEAHSFFTNAQDAQIFLYGDLQLRIFNGLAKSIEKLQNYASIRDLKAIEDAEDKFNRIHLPNSGTYAAMCKTAIPIFSLPKSDLNSYNYIAFMQELDSLISYGEYQ